MALETSLAVLGHLLLMFILQSQALSSGELIIKTAKEAFERASRRPTRDAATLESLLMPEAQNVHVVEFDLILDNDQYSMLASEGETIKQIRPKRKAVRHSIYHWPGAEIPYEIHSSVDSISPMARQRIQKAFVHWEKNTCVKFVAYDPLKHINSVSIRKGQWCASKLGMAGGVQPLYLALGCLDTGTIIHEIGHTLGWVHEQARPDRDDYVTIKWDLVSASYKSQYVKHDTDFVNTHGVAYDYDSIMHYPSYGELITKDPRAQYRIGQRNQLSFNDIKLANVMYRCAERAKCDTSKLECIDGGFIGKDCKCVCPNGDPVTCSVTNSIYEPFPKVATTPAVPAACNLWSTFDNVYIPGNNDDVGFSMSPEDCQKRCMQEKSFVCKSFDYWKQRKQCYLSSVTASGLGIRFSSDPRMVHFVRNDCPPISGVTAEAQGTSAETTSTLVPNTEHGETKASEGPTTITPTSEHPPNPVTSCPFEYKHIGKSCIRALDFPTRSEFIAHLECEQRLGAKLWNMNPNDIHDTELINMVDDNSDLWVKVDGYKSTDVLSAFFSFCPYITKANGMVSLKDTYCYKPKGFLCQL